MSSTLYYSYIPGGSNEITGFVISMPKNAITVGENGNVWFFGQLFAAV